MTYNVFGGMLNAHHHYHHSSDISTDWWLLMSLHSRVCWWLNLKDEVQSSVLVGDKKGIRPPKHCINYSLWNVLSKFPPFASLGGSVVQRVSDRRTFTGLHRTCSYWITIYMGKPSAVGQPTRPTQPFILTGSINE